MSVNKPCQFTQALPDANVTIAIKGLAMCNYNENNQNWEVVFLCHVQNHNLKITVNKCKGGDLVESSSYDIDSKDRIFVRSNRAKPQKPGYDSGDEMDLKNILDFSSEELYDGKVAFRKELNVPLTFLSISDCLFYTKEMTKNTYHILKNGERIGKPKNIGMILGGDMVCESGGMTEILVAGRPNMFPPLVAEDDVVYEVIFDNICIEPPERDVNDFDNYAECLDMTDTFTMALAEETDPGEKQPPCNKVIVSSLDGVDSLADLL